MQSFTGGVTFSQVLWMGQSFQMQGLLLPQTPEQTAQLILQLWGIETGQAWELVEQRDLPWPPSVEALREQNRQMLASLAGGMQMKGAQVQDSWFLFGLVARSGDRLRLATAMGALFQIIQPGAISGVHGGVAVPLAVFPSRHSRVIIVTLDVVSVRHRVNP